MKAAANGALVVDPRPRDVVGEVAADSPLVPEAETLRESRALLRRTFTQRLVRRLRAGVKFLGFGALATLSRLLFADAKTVRRLLSTRNMNML